jgi:DNA-binding transcriptional LysR family regulator
LKRIHCEHAAEVTAFLAEHGRSTDGAHLLASEGDVLALLESNIGFCIMPQSSARSLGVSLLDLEGMNVSRTVSVFAVAGRQRSMAASTFIKMLRAADWSPTEPAPAKLTEKVA